MAGFVPDEGGENEDPPWIDERQDIEEAAQTRPRQTRGERSGPGGGGVCDVGGTAAR